ncbi:MAG: flagellar biosynthetic protein FliO [Deltaproteobacteria bacterium]|nr:flagellar biosynthetic protein FliO [Deltaproteobacteria bacterium]
MTAPAWLAGRRNRLLAAAALLCAAAFIVPAEGLGGSALRACGLLAALAAAGRALRPEAATGRALAVLEREPLGRGGGLALVEVDGRRLLLGWAPAGTTLVADLTPGTRP